MFGKLHDEAPGLEVLTCLPQFGAVVQFAKGGGVKRFSWVLAMIPVLVVLGGMWRFNVVADVPYAGDPMIFVAEDGDRIEAHWKTDGSVEVRFMEINGDYLKAFLGKPARAASGARYDGKDGRFTFWTKGLEATVFHGDDPIFTGWALRETLYFDPTAREWRDAHGLCLTCTPAHGFHADGQIDGAPDAVWQTIRLRLTNDLGEGPPAAEVQDLFATHYSADPAWFGTHVSVDAGIYRIIVATPRGDTNFMAQNGALRAWYDVAAP